MYDLTIPVPAIVTHDKITKNQDVMGHTSAMTIVPTEVYMMQNAIDACTRSISDILRNHVKKNQLNKNKNITMIQPADMLPVQTHQYTPLPWKNHRISPIPEDLKLADIEGDLIDLWNDYAGEDNLLAQDELFYLLHYQEFYERVYSPSV